VRGLLVALILILSGCRATVTTQVDVGADGHGTVRAAVGLDDEALQKVGDVAAELRVDDLRQVGWTVEGPRKADDGLTWVRASWAFDDAEQANRALAQLSGPEGPFRDLELVRTSSLLRSTTRLAGTVDLSRGLGGFADADLAARVGDTLPLDVARLRAELGPEADRVLQVRFEASLPGSPETNAPTRSGGRAVWAPALGQQLRIDASSDHLRLVPLVPAVVAAVLLLAVLCGLLIVRRRRRI